MTNNHTDMLMNRVDTLVKSVGRSSAGAAGRLIADLEATLVEITAILGTAWDYCGTHEESDAAFKRFNEILTCYTSGEDAVRSYRQR